jgi:hypothetical protein
MDVGRFGSTDEAERSSIRLISVYVSSWLGFSLPVMIKLCELSSIEETMRNIQIRNRILDVAYAGRKPFASHSSPIGL